MKDGRQRRRAARWFPFYPADWINDIHVAAMPLAAQGAYFRLLCLQWENGKLPADSESLALLVGLKPGEFRDDFARFILPRFPEVHTEEGRFRLNGRLERLRANLPSHQNLYGGLISSQTTNEGRFIETGRSPGRKSVESKRDESKREDDDDVRLATDSVTERWNALAAKHGLRPIRGFSETRRRKLSRRLSEEPEFWTIVDEALGRRGAWARGRSFPTFDQVLEPRLFQRLLEGNYDGPAGERGEEERSGIIRELVRKNFTSGKCSATAEGMTGGAGVEPWSEVPLARLRRYAEKAK